jgi:hypothetical protein
VGDHAGVSNQVSLDVEVLARWTREHRTVKGFSGRARQRDPVQL